MTRLLASLVVIAAVTLPCHAQKPTIHKRRIAEEVNSVAPEVDQAEAALAKNDLPTAEKLLTEVVQKDANDPRAWFDLGYVFHATNRLKESVDAYRKAVNLRPKQFEASFELGKVLAASGDVTNAIAAFKSATTLQPEKNGAAALFECWLNLGRLEAKTADSAAAESAFRKAAGLKPQAAEPHVELARLYQAAVPADVAKQAQAESEWKEVMEHPAEPADHAEAESALVQLYLESGRAQQAEGLLRGRLQRTPNDGQARLLLADLLLKAGKHEDAITELQSAAQAMPDNVEVLHRLGTEYLAAHRFKEAAQALAHCAALQPKDGSLHYALGVAYSRLHDYDKAEEELAAAYNLDPHQADALGDLAVAASLNKHYETAIRALDERAKREPETPATYFLRATSYDNLKSYKQAVANYHRFLEVSGGKNPDQEFQARHRLIALEGKK